MWFCGCHSTAFATKFHLEGRFNHFQEHGQCVLYGSTDIPLYSNALRGVFPTPAIWSTILVFGDHDHDHEVPYVPQNFNEDDSDDDVEDLPPPPGGR